MPTFLLFYIIKFQTEAKLEPPLALVIFTLVFTVAVALGVAYFLFLLSEHLFGLFSFKPFIKHFHILKKELTPEQKQVLENDFSFYKTLTAKHKKIFEHRVHQFIKDKTFLARDSMVLSAESIVLISATAIMLTFGFRKYLINNLNAIIVYPDTYYSEVNGAYHKGEFNPMAGALVLSWKHFLEGYHNENDNINLGIHEMMHAIHLNSMRQNDISATIFKKKYNELNNYLSLNESIRVNVIDSAYFRDYAFTNQYEFLAVLVENFIETPEDFKKKFPVMFSKIKQMLNFNFPGY